MLPEVPQIFKLTLEDQDGLLDSDLHFADVGEQRQAAICSLADLLNLIWYHSDHSVYILQ